jgi:uncharacterized protein (DUF697 family)
MNDLFKTATEELKNKVMSEFNDLKQERDKHAETIIRNHVLFSVGAGAIPAPLLDIFAVGASQLDMIRQLCKVYNQDFSETQGKAIVSALTTSTLSKLGARSLVKLIPVVGSVLGGVANAILAGASTYALGQVFKLHFETGGTILDFDTKRLKKLYNEQFEKGKKVAEELQAQKQQKSKAEEASKFENQATTKTGSEASSSDTIQRLKELAELRKDGIITEEEFERMKKKLIQ